MTLDSKVIYIVEHGLKVSKVTLKNIKLCDPEVT